MAGSSQMQDGEEPILGSVNIVNDEEIETPLVMMITAVGMAFMGTLCKM